MSAFPQKGSLAWDTCACEGKNPPADFAGLPAAISALYDDLGRSAALGALAQQMGIPAGGELLESVQAFAEESPTLAEAPQVETGSVFSAIKGIGKGAVGIVERRAEKTLAALGRHKEILGTALVIGAGYGLGSRYLSGLEQARIADITGRHVLVADAVGAAPPGERVKALAALQGVLSPGDVGGFSLFQWLAFGAVALAVVWAWKAVRS